MELQCDLPFALAVTDVHITEITSNYKATELSKAYVQPLDGMTHSDRLILTLDYISRQSEY